MACSNGSRAGCRTAISAPTNRGAISGAGVRAGVRDGLLALRVSTHLFFACSLVAALVMLRQAGVDWWTVGCATVALPALSHPQHKQFEHGAMLLAWTANLALWMHPSAWTLGAAAATVGLSLFLGFNLFLYFGAALLLTLVLATAIGVVALEPQTLSALVGGGLLGLFPFACMACVPGFARNFHRRRVASVLARGESNLALPLPWPWREAPRQMRSLDLAHRRAFGWVFLAMLALPLIVLVVAVSILLGTRRWSRPPRWRCSWATTRPVAPTRRTSPRRSAPCACCRSS